MQVKRIVCLLWVLLIFTFVKAQVNVKILKKSFKVNGELQFNYDFNAKLGTPTHNDYYLNIGADTIYYTRLVTRKGESQYSIIQIEKVAKADIDWSNKMIWEQSLGYGINCFQLVLAVFSGKQIYRYYYNDSDKEEIETDKMMGINWKTREDASQWFDKTKSK